MKKNLKSKINQTVNAKIMEQKVFKTAYQEEQEAKDMAIYNEWNELMSVPEAARAKYEYNKKYQQRYWEKKAASKRAAAQQQIQTEPVSVSRNGMDDQRYITALEASNKTLNSENRRLVRLLHNYQKIIAQSTVAAL